MSRYLLTPWTYLRRRAFKKLGETRPSLLGTLLTLRTAGRRVPIGSWLRGKVHGAVGRLVARRYRSFDPKRRLFSNIQIETAGGCNLSCPFCPMNKKGVKLPQGQLPESVYEKILDELAGLGFKGRVLLYQNNEPLLDKRLPEFVRKAKRLLPKCPVVIESNGTLLNSENAKELLSADIDLVYINNYFPNKKGYETSYEQADAILERLAKMDLPRGSERRIIVHHRPWDVTLTNRAGNVPGADTPPEPLKAFCVNPFESLQVSVDGRVPLCCMDWKVEACVGDLTKQSIMDVWAGDPIQTVREALLSRKRLPPICDRCDFIGWP